MGNNKRTTSNDILVKVDQNNLMYIDPDSVVSNGVIEQRNVEQENLAMFVNLEADLIPRTILISDNSTNTLTSIAKGTLNMLTNSNGGDFDTSWTNAYTEISTKSKDPKDAKYQQSDPSGQSFGMETISIKTAGFNAPPQVSIRFIDVRGKTLFESPGDSPYKAFFHIPWPIFYLTIKGFYGKAVKYRLHLIKFSSRFNSANGNFEIDANFVGSTYAFLNDIPLDGILDSPYMFGIESDQVKTFNEKTGYYQKTLKKTTKGFMYLQSVYNEYVQKGLIDPSFATNPKTLREILIIARRLNKILESEIFSKVAPPVVLAGVKEFEQSLMDFDKQLINWKAKNLGNEFFTDLPNDKINWYMLSGKDKSTLSTITGLTTNTLEKLINDNVVRLSGNQAFGSNRNKQVINQFKLDIHPVSFAKLQNIKEFVKIRASVGIAFDELYNRFLDVQKDFAEQRDKLEKVIETKMNETVKRKDIGIGFEPTIRNIVGVILANAEVYVRLLKDVHYNAFDAANRRKDKIGNLSTESIGESIYPWPEIKKPVSGDKQSVLAYPGSADLVNKLGSDDKTLWPEVDFVENFFGIATKKMDPLSEKEGDGDMVNFVFESNSDTNSKKDFSTLMYLSNANPYVNKSLSSIMYELWERAKYFTTVDSYPTEVITEMALNEFENLKTQIEEDLDIISILKEKVKTEADLRTFLQSYSPYDRYPYYQDQLPTVSYLQNVLANNFKVEKYVQNTKTINNDSFFPKLQGSLNEYVSENYRTSIYPFNSATYLSYLGKTNFTNTQLNLNGIIQLNTTEGFLTSPIDPLMWVKDEYRNNNLFDQTLTIQNQSRPMLNTPYFHQQLFNDFTKDAIKGKYAGSAYLLLNSLPFKDLDDTISYDQNWATFYGGTSPYVPVLMSSMFREIGASHYVPYHLMVKWGSIYHRYKKYLLDGVDIISGITNPINIWKFTDNDQQRDYSVPFGSYNYYFSPTPTGAFEDLGISPFYHSVFHQIVNNYTFYNQPSTTGTTSYNNSVISKVNKIFPIKCYDGLMWTSVIDNSKFDSTDSRYTLMPSNGFNYLDRTDKLKTRQDNFRLIYSLGNLYMGPDDTPNINYSGETFPTSDEYFKNIKNEYSISNNNKKVLDLIATFNSDTLDTFENAFLEFSTQYLQEESTPKPYDVKYFSFQKLLKDIASVDRLKTDDDLTLHDLILAIKDRQMMNLGVVSQSILSNDNLIKITLGNPKEIIPYVLGGYTQIDSNNFSTNPFFSAQVDQDALNLIKLYIGEDIDGHYLNFFSMSDIELNEENIKMFRFLIYIYAGYVKSGGVNNKQGFVTYLKDNIINKDNEQNSGIGGNAQRLSHFLNILISQFKTLKVVNPGKTLNISRGYNDDPHKLELYNFFKSFNDKWVAGNSIGQRTLMEEFLFLDKRNVDIGDKVFIAMDKLLDIMAQKNKNKLNLYSLITVLISGTGFTMRALPAYINWYGTNYTNKTKITPSKRVAKDIFGTFLEVDYQDSSPKIILQYTGPNSKHLEVSDINKKYKFKNDSFDVSNVNKNPLMVTPEFFRKEDLSKSNKVVAFEVSFGDQSQSMFKGLQLDQTSIKNTSESFGVLERLGNSETGSSTAQVDVGLFDIYKGSSYTCDVTMMGNAMIQPTMYFYLKNVPLFRGSYWITEVDHTIKPGSFETTFKGSRIPLQSLPNPEDSFSASYRALFDKLTNTAVAKQKQADLISSSTGITHTEKTLQDPEGGSYSYNMGTGKTTNGEKLIEKAGVKEYAIAYNGYADEKYITLVKLPNGEEWLRTYVLEMGSSGYTIDAGNAMSIVTRYEDPVTTKTTTITWGDIKDDKNSQFYSTKFILSQKSATQIVNEFPNTQFMNPNTNSSITIKNKYDFSNKKFTGPVNIGPMIEGFGMGMSTKLMKDLKLYNGDIVYFRLK